MAAGQRTESLTRLLKNHGSKLSAVAANKKLVAAGILEEKQRPSSTKPGVFKKYKALTEAGARYGENIANDRAEGQTAPYYFVEMFAELVEKHLSDEAS